MTAHILTQAILKELLHYDPDTGDFTWLPRTFGTHGYTDRGVRGFNARHAGNVAGAMSDKGYLRAQLFGKIIPLHRLAWLYVHGEWPEQIDHINHQRSDNRIANLRDITQAANCRNRQAHKRNKSGYGGVCRHRANNTWIASIGRAKEKIYLGSFATFEDAVRARKQAERELEYHPNHGLRIDP